MARISTKRSATARPHPDLQSSQIILDRARIKDGANAGRLTAEYVLQLVDSSGRAEIVWRGWRREVGEEAARSYIADGAIFIDRSPPMVVAGF